MSLRDIPRQKLKEVAKYLDGFPPGSHGDDEVEREEQYWGLFVKELKRIPNVGKKFSYTNVQIVEFGEEDLKGRSPSLKLLYDLQEKKLELDSFVYCLQKINCRGAQNVFCDATAPIITQQPEPRLLILKRDEHIIFTIDAKCDPGTPQFQWFKQETPLVGEKSNKLVIYNAHRGNSGFYICRVTNPFINDEQKASVFSQWVEVQVQEVGQTQAQSPIRQETIVGRGGAFSQYPLIVRQPSPQTVGFGRRAVLECKAEGAVVFDWYKDGKPFRKGTKDGRLVFEKVRMEDGGEYQCAVVNDRAEVKSCPVRLTVESEIEIISQPEDVSSHVGGEVTLYCQARSTWHRDKKLVYQWFVERGDGDHEVGSQGSQERLQVKLNYERHKVLRVHCVVSLAEDREAFVRSTTARITVNSVWFTQQPQPIEGYIGQRACLICEAEGHGIIAYLWLKSSTKDGRKELVKPGSGLTINGGILSFEWLHGQKHRGYYTCQAENDQHHIESETVLVSAVPRTGNERGIKPPLIRIMKHPRSQVVPQGGRFRLICRAVSTEDEPLHYQWYHSGIKLNGENQTEFVRNNILDGQYGSYFCEVKTQSARAREVSQPARIKPGATGSGLNLEKKSGEQLKQMEAERRLVTAKDERYALEKVALLIGNQKYECREVEKLVSPENDIRELGKVLEAPPLNFKVISLVNLKYSEMMKAFEEFYQMLAVPGVYAVFYYSGHGFNYLANNYLVPVDATLPLVCENNIEANSIGLGMQTKLSRAVMVLDCCRISKDDIPPPQSSLTSLNGYANHIEITSCADNTVALESRVESCSKFNVAFRKALARKTSVHNIFTSVQDALREAELSLNGDAHQRASYKGSFADDNITLHDDVMMDDPKTEEQLDKICQRWQLAQTLPAPAFLSGQILGEELAGLVEVQLSFSADFSNVLLVAITVWPLQENLSNTTIDFDKGFLEAQGVHGELSLAHNPKGLRSAMFRITDIQRIKDTLTLMLSFRVTAGGVTKVGTVTYKLQQKPLFACLLEQSSS